MDSRLDHAYRNCIRLTRRSGSNFVYAFRTLPGEMYREMCALYAYMRKTDDLGDAETRSITERAQALTRWKQELSAVLSGAAVDDPILMAVADVRNRNGIPESYLFDVIAGVESDLGPRTFGTRAELETYCYQVAGAVGLCCVHIWGFQGTEPRQSAIACGNAFQLTNILRDLAEDRRVGRVYLPLEELQQFDLTPDSLFDTDARGRARELVRYQVKLAWDYYAQARPILDSLSVPGRRIQGAFLEIYGSLLREIERRSYDVFSGRIRLSYWKKLSVSCRCLLGISRPLTLVTSMRTSGLPPQPTH